MNATNSHILVIDDNEDILFMIEAMLNISGYKVSTRENVDNIETVVKELAPNLILMDMLLSGADGREVCAQLKANATLSHIPIIMLSAHPHAKAECLAAGADYFLSKPFDMDDLLKMVALH